MGFRAIRNTLLAAGMALVAPGAGAADMASAAMLSDACAPCHGPAGNSDGPAIPGIAGLSRNYFIAAMLAYKYDNDEDAIEKVVAANPSVLDADEFEALPRSATIMGRIAKGYEDAEIFAMADVFPKQAFAPRSQGVEASLAKTGATVHENSCEKCHEDGGTTSVDDVGILAGQWMPYLRNALADFRNGDRKMPKKMASKMKELNDADIEALLHFYGSAQQ
jgi:sulfide dehydrogenase cytochrome subunit